MIDLDQALNGEQPESVVEDAPEAETTQPEPETPETQQAETPEPAPEPAPIPADDPRDKQIAGLTAALGEVRGELRAFKQAQPSPEPKPAPDFYEDPAAAVQHQVAPLQQAVVGTKLEMSRFMAEREFGKEIVAAAYAYFDANPAKSVELLSHPSPFHAAVDEFNKVRVAEEIGKDPDAWRAAETAKIRAQVEAEMVAKQAQERAAQVAPSMADVTGTGGGPKTTWSGPTPLDRAIGN